MVLITCASSESNVSITATWNYVINFLLTSNHQHLPGDYVHILIQTVFVSSASEGPIVVNKDWFTMCRGIIQTRGNFPLPYSAISCPELPSKPGATFRCLVPLKPGAICHYLRSEVAYLEGKFRARWALIVCKNSFWKFLLKLIIFSKTISFSKIGPCSDPKRRIFSAHNLTCMISKSKIE